MLRFVGSAVAAYATVQELLDNAAPGTVLSPGVDGWDVSAQIFVIR